MKLKMNRELSRAFRKTYAPLCGYNRKKILGIFMAGVEAVLMMKCQNCGEKGCISACQCCGSGDTFDELLHPGEQEEFMKNIKPAVDKSVNMEACNERPKKE